MSASQKAAKPTSRWGFITQAVASVESRLDNILADEEEAAKKASTAVQPATNTPQPKRVSIDSGRTTPNATANDRLQERLARAMAKKAASRTESPANATEPISRTTTPVDQDPTPRPRSDSQWSKVGSEQERGSIEVVDANEAEKSGILPPTVIEPGDAVADSSTNIPDPISDEQNDFETSLSVNNTGAAPGLLPEVDKRSLEIESPNVDISSVRTSVDSQSKSESPGFLSLRVEHEAAQAKLQEELHIYIERIDALQAKLQYLTKEAADSAKQAAADAPSGSLDRKLHERDEKIALLMEEGTKLSKTEVKHLGMIKKLRLQAQASTKEYETTKTRTEKAEKALTTMEERVKRAEAASKRAEQSLATASVTSNELESLKRERTALNSTLADMKGQLSRANARAEAAESKAQAEQLEVERRKAAELRDDLTSAKIERELAEEKLRREIKDLQSALDREKEHSRAMETEMLGEQATLEAKLETFRARAEEVSTGDHGTTHVNLLRQVETLQSQYAAASQNWQGIEGTMLARITALEKERNDVASRESDLRKKLREASLRSKHAERQLDEFQNRYAEVEKGQNDHQQELERSQKKIRQLEIDLSKAQEDVDNKTIQFERDLIRRLDEEKSKWAASLHASRIDTPGSSVRKGPGHNFDAMQHLLGVNFPERPSSRKPSVMSPDSRTPPRLQSTTSLRGLTNGGVVETPSIVTSPDPDGYFPHVPATPASIGYEASPRALNELVSNSTVGAGPSVQLVERMSANVRRLESEKAASKDELARLTAQRDEARQEVVNFMREVEQKRSADDELQKLRKMHEELDQRHQTTLELLGEKSEQVDELRADILDVKQMYRQLADTMK